MKRIITTIIAAALLVAAVPASAASYYGYARNWWVEENGDITYYFLNQANTAYVTGLCGWGVYRLKVGQVNYNEVYTSLMMAAKNGYQVIMEVTTCSAQVNIIKMVKVCTIAAEC